MPLSLLVAVLGAPLLRHDPPQATIDTATRTVEVRLVEVPVPTRDWPTETAQMGVAAILGAVLAAQATTVRLRRRLPPGPGSIDITDVVRPDPSDRQPGSDSWPAGWARSRPS